LKRLIAITIFSLLLPLNSCTLPFLDFLLDKPDEITEYWQTVTINGFGNFKVPAEWNIEQQEGVLYITDKPLTDDDYAIYLIGTIRGADLEPHEFFDEIERGKTLLSPSFNGRASLLLIEYIVNGIEEEHHLIKFYNLRGTESDVIELFVWNRNVVDEYLAEQITRTYKVNLEDFENANIGELMSVIQ